MKTIGSVCLISCALLLSACAVEVSDEEFADETVELEGETVPPDSPVAGEVELAEQSIESSGPSVAPDHATVDGEAVGNPSDRVYVPTLDGRCHTFDYLRELSDLYCSTYGLRAVERNYTHGCTGWWGRGARYVWFHCGG
jgi:hypothetical protein